MGGSCQTTAPATNLSDFIYEINMKIVSGISSGSLAGAGIEFRENGSGYALSFQQDGSYNLYASINSAMKSPFAHGLCKSFRQGQMNQIIVRAKGDTFNIFVNSAYLTNAKDSSLQSGQIGVQMWSGDAPAEVIYSDLKLWKL
jgi:hypothetical protein